MNVIDLNLKLEAGHLYRCLFKRELPEATALYYISALGSLSEHWSASEEQAQTLQLIVRKELPATAIEPWLRQKGSRHIVSAKLLLLAHLDECSGGERGALRNTRLGRIRLLATVVRGVVSLAYGYYLKKRYGLV